MTGNDERFGPQPADDWASQHHRAEELRHDARPDELAAPDEWAEIEAMIGSAGHYVWPSDDLRPRVLEAARQRAGQRRTLSQLAAMMAAAILCVVAGVSVSQRLQAMAESAAMPRGQRLERMIDDQADKPGQTPAWALADIVSDWRNNLASRLPEGSKTPEAEILSDPEPQDR